MKALTKIWALIALTFRESLARKTFVTFFIISTLVHLFFIFVIDFDVIDAGLALVRIGGKDVGVPSGLDTQGLVTKIQSGMSFAVFSVGIILSIFTTAGLIPTMLEKRNVGLLLSKPLRRSQIFLSRFMGALLIMAFNVTYLIAGTLLILGLKTGIWYVPALYIIPMVVMAFACIYAPMALVGVLTGSSGATVMVAFVIVFLSPLLQHTDKIYSLLSSKVYYYLLDALYQALPKISEIGQITQSLVVGEAVQSWAPFWTSTLAAAVFLATAVSFFSRKDY